jgi:hypothetical protein
MEVGQAVCTVVSNADVVTAVPNLRIKLFAVVLFDEPNV